MMKLKATSIQPKRQLLTKIVRAEMLRFGLEKRLPRLNSDKELNDPLLWWKVHEFKFPLHASLAQTSRNSCYISTSRTAIL